MTKTRAQVESPDSRLSAWALLLALRASTPHTMTSCRKCIR